MMNICVVLIFYLSPPRARTKIYRPITSPKLERVTRRELGGRSDPRILVGRQRCEQMTAVLHEKLADFFQCVRNGTLAYANYRLSSAKYNPLLLTFHGVAKKN